MNLDRYLLELDVAWKKLDKLELEIKNNQPLLVSTLALKRMIKCLVNTITDNNSPTTTIERFYYNFLALYNYACQAYFDGNHLTPDEAYFNIINNNIIHILLEGF